MSDEVMGNEKTPVEGRESEITYYFEDADTQRAYEHFRNYGNELGKEVEFRLQTNRSQSLEAIVEMTIKSLMGACQQEKMRLIIDYDYEYPYILVKKINHLS